MTKGGWKILMAILFPLTLLGVIYHYYYVYKVLTAKCQFCGKGVEGQWGRKIGFIYTPWRKIKFICLDCQKKKP